MICTFRSAESVCKVPAFKEEKDRDPLILCNKNGQTGIHVALECGKAERAIILLKVSKGIFNDAIDLGCSTR